ncbi:MAG: 4-hydroxythreonine-4-phosphate dehydrogenase PdxA [Burkholderiaceae bacterium]|nr:4-hydroxythreonine-4-phosphate dehydrogenase PdxA [Burkholderiaceae bacterium]
MSEVHLPRIAITMGDPAGVGPEIVCKALLRLSARRGPADPRIVVVGSGAALASAGRTLGKPADIALRCAEYVNGTVPGSGVFSLIDIAPAGAPVPSGRASEQGGRIAYLALERAVQPAMDGTVDAIVTAPLSKEALHLAGFPFSGHTDLLAHFTRTAGPVMMLVHENMRVSHVSTHLALSEVPRALTAARLARVVGCTHETLIELGIARPRIAVAALNPHGGEGGIFGDEDDRITAPEVARLRSEGLDIEGPIPGDTVFVKARGGQYDAVVAMYHDQGHIPVKLLGFRVDHATGKWTAVSGVNVTLGLPIVRTSVDHGTAFDIAGQGVANEESLMDAIDLALRLSRARLANGAQGGAGAARQGSPGSAPRGGDGYGSSH